MACLKEKCNNIVRFLIYESIKIYIFILAHIMWGSNNKGVIRAAALA